MLFPSSKLTTTTTTTTSQQWLVRITRIYKERQN